MQQRIMAQIVYKLDLNSYLSYPCDLWAGQHHGGGAAQVSAGNRGSKSSIPAQSAIIRTKIILTETNQRLFILFTFLQNPTLRLRLAQFGF